MYPDGRPTHYSCRGFSLPLAIFVITALALIGTAMVTITQTSQESVANEIQSIRAFYAAESGAQFAMHRLFPLDGGATLCTNVLAVSPMTFTGSDLDGCNTALECTKIPAQPYYVVTSTSQCDFANISTSRKIKVMAKRP